MLLSAGTRLSPYEILSALGAGGMVLVNAIVGDSDNVPLDVTLNWSAGL